MIVMFVHETSDDDHLQTFVRGPVELGRRGSLVLLSEVAGNSKLGADGGFGSLEFSVNLRILLL